MPHDCNAPPFSAPRYEAHGWTGVTTRPKPMEGPHWHEAVEFNEVHAGLMRYDLSGRSLSLGPGQAVAFWGASPHQVVRVAPDTVFSVLTLPLAWLFSWEPSPDLLGRLLGGEWLARTADGTVARWVDDVRADRPERTRAALLEIQAWLIRADDAATGERGRVEPTLVARLAVEAARRYAEGVGPSDLARRVGVAPAYAMRQFRRATGWTLGQYLLEHRLAHAERLLASTDWPVAQVAARSGFGSLSQFHALFARRHGTSPGTHRRSTR